jgi:hypothetical protein
MRDKTVTSAFYLNKLGFQRYGSADYEGYLTSIHPAGHLQTKPWGQKEFSILDPDNNLLTFGEQAPATHAQ